MDDNVKLLFAVAKKLLYTPQSLEAVKKVISTGQQPAEALGRILAAIFQQAVAKSQQSGAKLNNQVVSQAAAALVNEAVEVLAGMGKFEDEQLRAVAKALLGTMMKALKELTNVPKPQPQAGGLVQQAMGGV